MQKITKIKGDACFRGTFKSILSDSGYSDESVKSILDDIENKTGGNQTYIEPSDVPALVFNSFKDCEVIPINNINDISNQNQKVDNETSFGVFFFRGNSAGINRHVTRLVALSEDNLVLMNPEKGEIRPFSFNELKTLSPKGFDLIVIKK